jgi:ankyrin repeat protein
VTATTGPSPILEAVYREDDAVGLVNALLARGADPEARTRDGQTALAIAEARGHAAVARRLRGELP